MKEIDYYECTLCGYRITECEFLLAAFDYPCHRCKVKTLSNYEVVYKSTSKTIGKNKT